MAIGAPIQGTAAANTVAGTTLAVPYPAGVNINDVLELQVEVSSATAPTTPAGWTLQVDLTAGGSSPAMRAWTKYADSGDVTSSAGAGSLNVTTPNVTSQGRMRVFTGVDRTTMIDATPGTFSSSVATTAYTISQVTTTMANTMLSVVGAGNINTGAWTAPTSQGGGWTKDWDNASPTPKSVHCYLLWTGSGASGTVNLVNTSVRGCAAVIPYRPAFSIVKPPLVVNQAALIRASVI